MGLTGEVVRGEEEGEVGDERLEVEEERDEMVELGDIGVTGATKGIDDDMIDRGLTGDFHTNLRQ